MAFVSLPLNLPSCHHSEKGTSLALFSASQQSLQRSSLVLLLLLCSLLCHLSTPWWVQVDHIEAEAILILPRESPAISSMLKDTRYCAWKGLSQGPDQAVFPCLSVPICKMAEVTSFTGEVAPLTSSAGLDIVGISEPWQKLDKLVGDDAVRWSFCAVCEEKKLQGQRL